MTLRDCNYPNCAGNEECHMCTRENLERKITRWVPLFLIAALRRWHEFGTPSFKCERVGHKPGIEYRKGYRKPSFENREYHYYICVGVSEQRSACLRCQKPLTDWVNTRREGYQSYSWPSDMVEQFKRDGEYWTNHGYRKYIKVGDQLA